MTLKAADFNADPKVEKVEVTELGDHCFLRVMSAKNRDAYDASVFDGETRNVGNLSARLVARCLCDEDGKLIFDNRGLGEKTLGDAPTNVVEFLYHECRRVNGMGQKAVEEAAKNSNDGQS